MHMVINLMLPATATALVDTADLPSLLTSSKEFYLRLRSLSFPTGFSFDLTGEERQDVPNGVVQEKSIKHKWRGMCCSLQFMDSDADNDENQTLNSTKNSHLQSLLSLSLLHKSPFHPVVPRASHS